MKILYVVKCVKLLLWLIGTSMLYTFLFAYLFYTGFALSISIYRLWMKGTLNNLNKAIFFPILFIFAVVDIVLNYILVLVMGISPPNTYTISDRFAVYHQGNYGWKSKVATMVCEKLLNTVDPTGNHC